MTPLTLLRRCYPQARVELRPGNVLSVYDPLRRPGLIAWIRAREQEIITELARDGGMNEQGDARTVGRKGWDT